MKKLIAVLVLILTMFTGCAREEMPFSARSYEAEEVTALSVDVRDRAIRVEASADDKVHIDYFDSEKEFFDITLEEGRLTMTAKSDKDWEDYIGKNAPKEHRTITVSLPKATLEALTLSTTYEDISLIALAAESVSITANGGNIAFEDLEVGSTLELDVKNGNINGTVLGGYDDFDITCTTKKGDCNLPQRKEGGEKTLSVKANNGDVNVELK